MNLTRVVLGIHWVPLLSGCLMGGMAHTGGIGRGEIGPMQGPLQHAEASSGELTIALSFPIPSTATAVPMEARLGTASDRREPTDGEIWLRIQTPGGNVDEIRMQRVDSSAGRTYQAMYSFRNPGSYLVTAEGRKETGTGAQTVSVTTRADVGGESNGGRNDWLIPAAILGGLGTVVTMVVVMGR